MNNDQDDTWHIDWASATPRRPGSPPRRMVTPTTYQKPTIAVAPIQLVDTIALEPSDRRHKAKDKPSLTWTIVKAGLILAAIITLAPALLRLLAFAGVIGYIQLHK